MKKTPPKSSRASTASAARLAEARLEKHCADHRQQLTPMRLEVFRYLQAQTRPQTAYQVLDGLKDKLQKKISPLSVYRALDFLAGEGWLHRLESMRAFLPCSDPEHHHTGVLFLCRDCGRAEEAEDVQIEAQIERDAVQRGFDVQHRVVEVLGLCRDCRA